MRRTIRAASVLGLLAAAACGGGEPESEYRWEEETVYEDRGPAPAPPPRGRYEEDDDSDGPDRRGGESGHYGRRAPRRAARSARSTPRSAASSATRACASATRRRPATRASPGSSSAPRRRERLSRRIDDEGARGARGIYRPHGRRALRPALRGLLRPRRRDLRETRTEFGHEAAEALSRRIDEPRQGPGRRDGVIYSPREGVACDEQVAVCYVADAAHPGQTKQQFGDDALRELERRLDGGRDSRDGIYRPTGGAVCDRLSEVCYDRNGASTKRTRDEFGRDAAADLAERLD